MTTEPHVPTAASQAHGSALPRTVGQWRCLLMTHAWSFCVEFLLACVSLSCYGAMPGQDSNAYGFGCLRTWNAPKRALTTLSCIIFGAVDDWERVGCGYRAGWADFGAHASSTLRV